MRKDIRTDLILCAALAFLLIAVLVSGKSVPQIYTGDRILDLLNGRGEIDRLSFRPPLYPLLLAFLETTLGGILSLPKLAALLNVMFITGSAWLGLRILLHLGVGNSRLFIVPLLLLFPYFLLENFVVRETIFYSFLVMLFLYSVLKWKGRILAPLALGAIAGSAALVRPSGIILLVAGIIILALFSRQRPKIRFAQVLGFVAVYAALLGPWAAFLSYHSGQTVLTASCTSGLNFFKGSSKEAGNFYLYADVDNLKVPLDPNLSRCAADAKLAANVKDQMIARAASEPFRFLRDAGVKFAVFTAGIAPIGRAQVKVHDDYTYTLSDTEFHMNSLLFMAIGTASYTLAGLGCWLAISRGSPEARRTMTAILLVVLGHQAIHVITWPETRYTFPFILPILMSVLYLVDRLRNITALSSTPEIG